MSETSPVLGLPYLQPSQAQKHVTHNEALRILDALSLLVAAEPPRQSPPANPAEGTRYIVAPGGQGAWAGQDHAVAVRVDGTWHFFAPQTGWRADIATTGQTLRFDGTGWTLPAALSSVPEIGVNTGADAVNRLAVSAEATLLTHEGAGHQLKLNKNAPGDTASLLYQTNWSGRAEMGTTGNDDFAIKVSGDGSSFQTGLSFPGGTGAVQMPQGQCFFDEVTLADNAAFARDIPWSDPARILMWIGLDAPGHAHLVAITGALTGAANFTAMSSHPTGSLAFATGPLSGTTGANGDLTLSIEPGSTPRLHLENRLGTSHQITLATLGR